MVASSGRYEVSDFDCPSETEKQLLSEERIKRAAEEREAFAAKELSDAKEIAIAEAIEKAAAAAAALKKAEEEARLLAERVAKDNADKAAEKQAGVEAELREEVEKEQTENQEALKQLEEESLAQQDLVQKEFKETQTRYLVGVGALGVLLFLLLFALIRRNKSETSNAVGRDVESNFNESGIDLIIRGAGLSLKIPEELLARERGATVGRSAADCDFVLDAPSVSRSHMKLILKDGLLFAEDLGSANGTMINGKQLAPGQLSALHDKDDLELAESHFSIEIRSR